MLTLQNITHLDAVGLRLLRLVVAVLLRAGSAILFDNAHKASGLERAKTLKIEKREVVAWLFFGDENQLLLCARCRCGWTTTS